MKRRIVIAGLGIGGSFLAHRLASADISVVAYDPSNLYVKPCGDAVTARKWIGDFLSEYDVAITTVNTFTLKINNEIIFDKSFKEKIWYIINKNLLINKMRNESKRYGAKILRSSVNPTRLVDNNDTLIVDARGPYAHSKSSWILVYRGIARAEWSPHHALLDFFPEKEGLFWVFPASDNGRLVNFGAGFRSGDIRSARRLAYKTALKTLGKLEIVEEKGAPIAVFSNILLIKNNIIKIGEAGGLVISTAGEGNRPALESAKALSDAIINNDVSRYTPSVKTLVGEARLSRRMLAAAARMGSRFGEFASMLPEEFWYRYLTGTLNIKFLMKLFIKKPYLMKYFL